MVTYCSTPAVLTLTLGSNVLDLMDQANGFRVASVDLGYPDVREDVDLRADAHGALDWTALFGARAITIAGSIVPSAAGSRSKAMHALAPFLNPGARPVLTYQIDADTAPRTMTLRPAAFTGPFTDPNISAFQLGYKAPDPLAYAPSQMVTVWPAPVGGAGRQYNLVFNRAYTHGGGSTTAVAPSSGDLPAYPLLRIYGPMTAISFSWAPSPTGPAGIAAYTFPFVSTFTIAPGDWVEVDCRRRTAYLNGNPAASVYSQIAWITAGAWPFIPAGGETTWAISASGTSPISQMQINWQDAYLL